MIGAVLAGGAGRRLGGGKPTARLHGCALATYPVEALRAVCDVVVVVCKPATALPDLPGTERWEEPEQPQHPLTGIVYALERAHQPVLVCAVDMPWITPDACRTILTAARAGVADAAVAVAAGVLQPTFGTYGPGCLTTLRAAPPDAPLARTVERLDPVRVALPPRIVRSVNTPEELAAAEAEPPPGAPDRGLHNE